MHASAAVQHPGISEVQHLSVYEEVAHLTHGTLPSFFESGIKHGVDLRSIGTGLGFRARPDDSGFVF